MLRYRELCFVTVLNSEVKVLSGKPEIYTVKFFKAIFLYTSLNFEG